MTGLVYHTLWLTLQPGRLTQCVTPVPFCQQAAGHHLQHNLGCLEDLIICQPEHGVDSATIVCAVCLTSTGRIIQITSQELSPDFTAVWSRELKLCALLLIVPGCSSKDFRELYATTKCFGIFLARLSDNSCIPPGLYVAGWKKRKKGFLATVS